MKTITENGGMIFIVDVENSKQYSIPKRALRIKPTDIGVIVTDMETLENVNLENGLTQDSDLNLFNDSESIISYLSPFVGFNTATGGSGAGVDGVDGDTPFINSQGNWQIGDLDTGVKAEGPQGESINLVTGTGEPNNSDGEPEGTIYIQTIP